MNKQELSVCDIVQIDPAHDDTFGGALMVVTEPKEWGAQGYVHGLGQGEAYYRCGWAHMELVGKAIWIAE